MTGRRSVRGKKEKNFEEALVKLEEIVLQLEEGELSLEEALKKFEEGVELSRFCTEKLAQAEEKVKKLIKTAEGKFRTVPADPEGEA